MKLHGLIVVLATACLVQPTQAIDLSSLRCEEPQMVDVMADGLKRAVVNGNSSLRSYGAYVEGLSKTKTVSATSSKLVCDVWARMTIHGATKALRGRYVLQQFGGGQLTANWSFS